MRLDNRPLALARLTTEFDALTSGLLQVNFVAGASVGAAEPVVPEAVFGTILERFTVAAEQRNRDFTLRETRAESPSRLASLQSVVQVGHSQRERGTPDTKRVLRILGLLFVSPSRLASLQSGLRAGRGGKFQLGGSQAPEGAALALKLLGIAPLLFEGDSRHHQLMEPLLRVQIRTPPRPRTTCRRCGAQRTSFSLSGPLAATSGRPRYPFSPNLLRKAHILHIIIIRVHQGRSPFFVSSSPRPATCRSRSSA